MDYTVDFQISVTADSPEQAAKFALSDLCDSSLGPWNATVSGHGRTVDVQVDHGHPTSAAPTLRLLEGPVVKHPRNGPGGLYMLVQRDETIPLAEFSNRLRELARAHHFNPDGRCTTGAPCAHGLQTVTNAVWFHEPLRK